MSAALACDLENDYHGVNNVDEDYHGVDDIHNNSYGMDTIILSPFGFFGTTLHLFLDLLSMVWFLFASMNILFFWRIFISWIFTTSIPYLRILLSHSPTWNTLVHWLFDRNPVATLSRRVRHRKAWHGRPSPRLVSLPSSWLVTTDSVSIQSNALSPLGILFKGAVTLYHRFKDTSVLHFWKHSRSPLLFPDLLVDLLASPPVTVDCVSQITSDNISTLFLMQKQIIMEALLFSPLLMRSWLQVTFVNQ